MKDRLIQVLNDYYGDSRSDDHKNEIADFIETRADEIFALLDDEINCSMMDTMAEEKPVDTPRRLYLFAVPVPKVGEKIYVPSAAFMSHGIDDFQGGKATVMKVEEGVSNGEPTIFVTVVENRSTKYNWEFLAEKQEELKKKFGDSVAHPDPDYRDEFNEP